MVWRCNAVNSMPRLARRQKVSDRLVFASFVSGRLFATLQYGKAEGHKLLALSQCSEQKTGWTIFASMSVVISAVGSLHFITRRGTNRGLEM